MNIVVPRVVGRSTALRRECLAYQVEREPPDPLSPLHAWFLESRVLSAFAADAIIVAVEAV